MEWYVWLGLIWGGLVILVVVFMFARFIFVWLFMPLHILFHLAAEPVVSYYFYKEGKKAKFLKTIFFFPLGLVCFAFYFACLYTLCQIYDCGR